MPYSKRLHTAAEIRARRNARRAEEVAHDRCRTFNNGAGQHINQSAEARAAYRACEAAQARHDKMNDDFALSLCYVCGSERKPDCPGCEGV